MELPWDCCGGAHVRRIPPQKLGWWHDRTGSKYISASNGSRFDFFRGFGCEAVFPIIADRLIDDRAAIDTFPGIEHQEEI